MLLTACTFSFSACSDSYMEDMNTDPSKADIIDPNAQLTTAELQTYGRLDMVDIFRNYLSLNPQLHSRSATYIKRNGLLIRKITIKSSRPFQCAYHPLTP